MICNARVGNGKCFIDIEFRWNNIRSPMQWQKTRRRHSSTFTITHTCSHNQTHSQPNWQRRLHIVIFRTRIIEKYTAWKWHAKASQPDSRQIACAPVAMEARAVLAANNAQIMQWIWVSFFFRRHRLANIRVNRLMFESWSSNARQCWLLCPAAS